MDCEALVGLVRRTIDDRVEPYLVEDDVIVDYLNEAVQEACVRGRLLHRIRQVVMVEAGEDTFKLPSGIYEIENIICHGKRLTLLSRKTGGDEHHRYHHGVGGKIPSHALQLDNEVRIYPTPDRTIRLSVDGYAVPVNDELMEDESDEPILNPIHHRKLVHWVVHKLFEIPDTEIFDPEKSVRALSEFMDYFGGSPDSDLRRITREDRPHTVQPFWV